MNNRPVGVRLKCVVAALAAALLFGHSAAIAAEAKQSTKRSPNDSAAKSTRPRADRGSEPSLDEQLLKDLDNDLLPGDDVPRVRPRPSAGDTDGDAKKTDKVGAAGDEGEDIGQSGEDDPLARISEEMRQAERLIVRRKSPEKTQELHAQIVSDLEKLIEQMQQRSQQQQQQQKKDQKTAQREKVSQPKTMPSESKQPSSQPAKDSTDQVRQNDPRRPDLAELKNLMKDVWGQLPEHDREQLLQNARPDEFLPKYELLIEKYYKRLAEQQKDRP